MEPGIYKQNRSEKLKFEFLNWQGKMNEVRLQMYMGTKEVQDRLLPHIRKLESEHSRVKEKWRDFNNAPKSARKDIEQALKELFKTMNVAFKKAENISGNWIFHWHSMMCM